MVCIAEPMITHPSPPTLLPLRERVRRWMKHHPSPDGRYEGFKSYFDDPRGPVSRHTTTGEEFIFSRRELERD